MAQVFITYCRGLAKVFSVSGQIFPLKSRLSSSWWIYYRSVIYKNKSLSCTSGDWRLRGFYSNDEQQEPSETEEEQSRIASAPE